MRSTDIRILSARGYHLPRRMPLKFGIQTVERVTNVQVMPLIKDQKTVALELLALLWTETTVHRNASFSGSFPACGGILPDQGSW